MGRGGEREGEGEGEGGEVRRSVTGFRGATRRPALTPLMLLAVVMIPPEGAVLCLLLFRCRCVVLVFDDD